MFDKTSVWNMCLMAQNGCKALRELAKAMEAEGNVGIHDELMALRTLVSRAVNRASDVVTDTQQEDDSNA